MHKDTPKIIPNAIKSLTDKKFSKSTPLLSSLHLFCYETGVVKKRRADNFLNIKKVLLTMLPQVELSTLSVGNFYMRHDGKVDFYNQGVAFLYLRLLCPVRFFAASDLFPSFSHALLRSTVEHLAI